MRSLWTALALLLLVAPPASPAPADTLLSVSSVQATGDVALEGTLAAHLQYGGDRTSGDAGGFSLAAARLTVETFLERSVEAAGVGLSPLPPETTRERFTDARAGAADARPMDFVLVRPLPGAPEPRVHQASACATASATVDPVLSPDRGPAGATRTESDVTRTLDVTSCGAGWTFEGSFLAVLWEWDLAVTAAEGTGVFTSGAEGPNGAGMAEYRLLYLEVRDGVLVLPGAAASVGRTHMDDATVTAAEVGLEDARGPVPDGASSRWVAGEPVRVGGSPVVALAWGEGGVVSAAVGGRVAWADVAGSPLAWTAPGGVWGRVWPGVAGGAAAAVGVLAALWGLRAVPRRVPPPVRAGRLRRRASGLLGAGRFRRAARAAGRAIRLDPRHGDGYALRALARSSLGHHEAALADHARAHRRLAGRERGLNALEAARVEGLRGRGAAAAHWLAIAAREDACALSEAVTEPDFAPVRASPAFRRVLRDVAPGFRCTP